MLMFVQTRVRLKEEGKLSSEECFPWTFGQVWGSKFNGKEMRHAINICFTRDKGFILIEPQNDVIRLMEKEKDEIYWVRF